MRADEHSSQSSDLRGSIEAAYAPISRAHIRNNCSITKLAKGNRNVRKLSKEIKQGKKKTRDFSNTKIFLSTGILLIYYHSALSFTKKVLRFVCYSCDTSDNLNAPSSCLHLAITIFKHAQTFDPYHGQMAQRELTKRIKLLPLRYLENMTG